MAKTYEELLEQAAIIRDETAAGKNTATRVGGTITDAVDYVKELQDTYAGIHAEAAEAKKTAETAQTTATSANKKNEEQDNRIANAEAINTKQNERLLNYVYPKIYQLNEGAGARAFHGFTDTIGIGSFLTKKDTYRYRVLYSKASKCFVLNVIDTANKEIKTVGNFVSWNEITLPDDRRIASWESYAQRDCLYFIFEPNEGSTYYYIDSHGVATEQSATYLLRRLVDKNAAAISKLQGNVVGPGGDTSEGVSQIKELGEFDTFAALLAKAAKFDIVSNNAIALLHGTYKKADVIYNGVLILQQVEKNNDGGGTAMQYIYNQNRQFTRSITFSATAVTSVQLPQNDGARNLSLSGRVLQMTNMWGENVGDSVTLPDNGNIYIDLPWDDEVQGQDGYINTFTERGEYHIHGERLYDNDGLPIINSGDWHTIDGLMTVLDSSLPNGNKYDACVTQILRLNNRKGGDGHIFVRTGIDATKSELQRSTASGWSPWEKLMGVFEKNAVSNATDLDKYTSSGMYDGMFVFSPESQTTVGGLKIENGSTFLMIAINGYAVAQTGVVPQVTQLLYVMPSGLDGSSGVRNAKLYTRTGIYVATTKTYTWGKFDGLAHASDITKLLGYIQDNSDLIQENQSAISANTKEIARVNSTATQAQETADRAQDAADTAQANADSASSAAATAQTAAETAQSTATAAQTKNTEQDARLKAIEDSVQHLSNAGRYWNEKFGTSTAEGIYGSLDALRSLPEKLGLGRYIVKDDRTRRKLDPKDSTKYADGTTANLDGTDGQCMWCWNGFYANIWKEGDNLYKVVSFDRPVGNDISIWIPAGGISWLGVGVMDRENNMLCSLISDNERYRGGGGTALDKDKYTIPPAESPQITMLRMPATMMSTTQFGEAARKRGLGWEANWFVARFVVEFLFEVIMGTENSQSPFVGTKNSDGVFIAEKGANGLYQGGFGNGVTEFTKWQVYNYFHPTIPTSVGLEAGDGVCLVPYSIPNADGSAYHTFNVPVFFGLVGAGYGNLWQWVRGLILDASTGKSLVYVTKSMYDTYYSDRVDDKILVSECPRVNGYIKHKSYRGLCCIPTDVSGTNSTNYSDLFTPNAGTLKYVRAAGGYVGHSSEAGASFTNVYYQSTHSAVSCSAPLCYFAADPIVQ